MRSLLASIATLVLLGCPPHSVRTPVLKEMGTESLSVQFVGQPYDPNRLYVCGTLEPGKISCVEYETFMRELERK